MKTFGSLLDKVQMSKVDKFNEFWYFPGYYFLNSLHLMQQKINLIQRYNSPESENEEDTEEAKSLSESTLNPLENQAQYMKTYSDFIGKTSSSTEPSVFFTLNWDSYHAEFEYMFKKAVDSYTSQENASRMINYIHSLASEFYFKQEGKTSSSVNYLKKSREMKNYIAKRLAKQSWNDVAVDLIEQVKSISLKMEDYESFFQSEIELINVKKEEIDVKKNRFNLILNKFEESKEKVDQSFSMNNPLITVYGRFD